MARVIPLTIGVYVVNPRNWSYRIGRSAGMLRRFLASIAQPHEIRYLTLKKPAKVTMSDLKPLTRTLNIVIIPDKKFFFDLYTHSESIMLVVSMAPITATGCQGLYYPILTLIRKYLGGLQLSIGTQTRRTLYRRLGIAGKVIAIATMVDADKEEVFNHLYAYACRAKLKRRQRNALIHVVLLKKKLYLLHKERTDAR